MRDFVTANSLETPQCPARPLVVSPVRWALAVLGVCSFGLGALGTVVPGLPTTVFLIIGSFCLVRSCPALERKLMESRLFKPYAQYLRPGAVMPMRARVVALVLMWLSIGGATALFVVRGASPWLAVVVIAAGVVGSVCIWRFRRCPAPQARGSGPLNSSDGL